MSSGTHLLIFSSILFCTGLTLVLSRKEFIRILIGLELMLNSANVNLIYFSQVHHQPDGHTAVLFIMIVAICEAAVGLALFLRANRFYLGANTTTLNQLHEE
jgi:NADH-quinone oxidoreductase subunit K